jgi:hypothetical protein
MYNVGINVVDVCWKGGWYLINILDVGHCVCECMYVCQSELSRFFLWSRCCSQKLGLD